MRYIKEFKEIDWDDWEEEEMDEENDVELLDPNIYIEDHVNGMLNDTVYTNYHNVFGNFGLSSDLYKFLNNTIKKFDKQKTTSFLYNLTQNFLDNKFKGIETDELGDGAYDLDLSSKIYFFRINGHICIIEYDGNGTQLRIPEGLSIDEYKKLMTDIYGYLLK